MHLSISSSVARSTQERPSDRDTESGVILVLLALMTTVLALLVGFALDTGNLYSARLAAQTAADAASLSGATAIAGRDASSTTITQSIATANTLATDLAKANLELKSAFDTTSSSFVVTPSSAVTGDRIEFSVEINSPVQLYLLNRIPGYEQSGAISVTATSRIRNANVMLMLDVSRSMRCPRTGAGATCACMDTNSCDPSDAVTKLGALKVAAKEFISKFDPARDRIGLTAFGHAAEVLVNPNASSDFDKSELDTQIDALSSAGATNISDALLRSYLKMKDRGVEDEAAYILFSDGAPSAARMLLADPAPGVGFVPIMDNHTPYIEPHNPLDLEPPGGGASFSRFDYISYAALWGKSSDPSFNVSSPHSLAFTPQPNGNGPGGCSWPTRPLVFDGAELDPECFLKWSIPSPGNASETFRNQFSSPAIYDPDGNIHKVGDYWKDVGGVPTYDWDGFDGEKDVNGDPLTNPQRGVYRKIYFDAALVLADFMRQKGGVIYSVGLGVPASFVLDPYQNPDFDHDLKTTFLKRMSYDACGVADPIDPPFPGFPGYDQLFVTNARAGMFVSTTDANELQQLFRTVAKKIKLSLVK